MNACLFSRHLAGSGVVHSALSIAGTAPVVFSALERERRWLPQPNSWFARMYDWAMTIWGWGFVKGQLVLLYCHKC